MAEDYRIEDNLLTLETESVADVVLLTPNTIHWDILKKDGYILHLFWGIRLGAVYEPEKKRIFLYHPHGEGWKWDIFKMEKEE